MQKAELIYSDRINTYRRLIIIDQKITENPDTELIAEFVELSIRNRLCREELSNYNAKGKFLFKHPILITNTLQRDLTELLLTSPDSFLSDYKNCELNITRYQSWMNNPKKSTAQKTNAATLIKKYRAKQEVMSAILKDKLYERQITQ